MKILAFDTALDSCSVAVLDGGRVLAARFEARARGHAEVLLPMLEAVRDEVGIPYAGFDRLAVSVGPGTFTGIRVGVATARGLTLATGIPAYGVSTLAALAQGLLLTHPEGRVPAMRIVAAIDARRDEAYHQSFAVTEAGGIEEHAPPRRDTLADIMVGLAERPGWLIGSAASLLQARLSSPWRSAAIAMDAVAVGILAAQIPAEMTVGSPVPLYLRAPDAKLPRPRNTVPTG